jgi:hypothetical protein
MASRSLETLAVIAVVTTVLVVGCSGGFGPTLPSPDSTPTNDTPINDTPVNDTPVNDTPVNDTPTNNTPVNDTPVNDTPINDIVNSASVTGQVIGYIGEPVADVTVSIDTGDIIVEYVTGSDGRFRLAGLTPGTAWTLDLCLSDYCLQRQTGTLQAGENDMGEVYTDF